MGESYIPTVGTAGGRWDGITSTTPNVQLTDFTYIPTNPIDRLEMKLMNLEAEVREMRILLEEMKKRCR